MNDKGATLIGVIAATVIIGMLATLVVVLAPANNPELKIRSAKEDIRNYRNALELYALDDNGVFPKELEAITRVGCGKTLKSDPWKNPYHYAPPTDPSKGDYSFFSAGPDGIPGNDDDVTIATPIGAPET